MHHMNLDSNPNVVVEESPFRPVGTWATCSSQSTGVVRYILKDLCQARCRERQRREGGIKRECVGVGVTQ